MEKYTPFIQANSILNKQKSLVRVQYRAQSSSQVKWLKEHSGSLLLSLRSLLMATKSHGSMMAVMLIVSLVLVRKRGEVAGGQNEVSAVFPAQSQSRSLSIHSLAHFYCIVLLEKCLIVKRVSTVFSLLNPFTLRFSPFTVDSFLPLLHINSSLPYVCH